MEETGSGKMPTYGVRPWFVIIYGLSAVTCLILGIVADTSSDGDIGLHANIWLLASITLMIASLGSAMVSLLATIARRR